MGPHGLARCNPGTVDEWWVRVYVARCRARWSSLIRASAPPFYGVRFREHPAVRRRATNRRTLGDSSIHADPARASQLFLVRPRYRSRKPGDLDCAGARERALQFERPTRHRRPRRVQPRCLPRQDAPRERACANELCLAEGAVADEPPRRKPGSRGTLPDEGWTMVVYETASETGDQSRPTATDILRQFMAVVTPEHSLAR